MTIEAVARTNHLHTKARKEPHVFAGLGHAGIHIIKSGAHKAFHRILCCYIYTS